MSLELVLYVLAFVLLLVGALIRGNRGTFALIAAAVLVLAIFIVPEL